jgi:hypothetical protein
VDPQPAPIDPVGPLPHKLFTFEYLTGAFLLYEDDGIQGSVLNPTSADVDFYMEIHNGSTLTLVDHFDVTVPPGEAWGFGFTALPNVGGGAYWLRLRTSSEFLIPTLSWVRSEQAEGGKFVPFVNFRPGDFAIFRLRPTHERIW